MRELRGQHGDGRQRIRRHRRHRRQHVRWWHHQGAVGPARAGDERRRQTVRHGGQPDRPHWAGFKAAVSWTFDDSQPSQIAHYAELAAVGIPMTFYISSGNSSESGYDATWTQAVADGSEIGNHTVHHCHADLTGCSFGTAAATLAHELDDCTSYIAQHYAPQTTAWTAASPFGDTGYDSDDMSRFLVNRGVAGGTIGAERQHRSVQPPHLPGADGRHGPELLEPDRRRAHGGQVADPAGAHDQSHHRQLVQPGRRSPT